MATNGEGVYFGLFPKREFTEESKRLLQDYVDKSYIKIQVEDNTIEIDGRSLFGTLLLQNLNKQYIGIKEIPVLTFTRRSANFQKAFGQQPLGSNFYGIFNQNTLNQKIKNIYKPGFNGYQSLLDRLAVKRAELDPGNSRYKEKQNVYDGLERRIKDDIFMLEHKVDVKKALLATYIKLPTREEFDTTWQHIKSLLKDNKIKIITIPLKKLTFYEGLNEGQTTLIHHANYIVIRKAAKLWYLVEPQKELPPADPEMRKLYSTIQGLEFKIITKLGKLIDEAAEEEYQYDPIRVLCPQAITQDYNCIWWSLFLTYILSTNESTGDFNMLLKSILRKYGSELPSLIESFKVFVLDTVKKAVNTEKDFNIEGFDSLLSKLQVKESGFLNTSHLPNSVNRIKIKLGGARRTSKLKPRRATKRLTTAQNGKWSHTRRIRRA